MKTENTTTTAPVTGFWPTVWKEITAYRKKRMIEHARRALMLARRDKREAEAEYEMLGKIYENNTISEAQARSLVRAAGKAARCGCIVIQREEELARAHNEKI